MPIWYCVIVSNNDAISDLLQKSSEILITRENSSLYSDKKGKYAILRLRNRDINFMAEKWSPFVYVFK